MKSREGYYRNWDHQLMQEMYTVQFKPASEVKDKWELFTLSAAGAGGEPEPGSDRADARRQQLHDARLTKETNGQRSLWPASAGRGVASG